MEDSQPQERIIELAGCNIWQQDHLVLTNVNLNVSKGEFIYLVGKVGSGKSSLIKTLNAQLPLKEGTGIVAGFNLSAIKTREIPYLRRKIGIVFQDFQLLIDRSVNDNLEFVLRATGWKDNIEIDKRINEVLDKVGLNLKGYKMPHQLSGGEQQRVVIGRALLNEPEIILADEPTGNLDSAMGNEIMEILEHLNRNDKTTIVMVTHDEGMAKRTHRLVRLFDGSLVSNSFLNT
jgi:cell division transport system ATP-binding protein